jgi:PPOX class probable F420-dependent enzyme
LRPFIYQPITYQPMRKGESMATILPDPATPFGERVARRLREEVVIWLTVTGADGTPQPSPVWFLWEGETFLIYTRANAKRLGHIERNPRVALNFDSDGGDIIVFTGEARRVPDVPSADQNPAYAAKYQQSIAEEFQTAENFAQRYPVPLRITPTRVRGY